MTTIGPVAIPNGGLIQNLNIPGNPGLAGRIVHLQGGINEGGGNGHLTNKVSVRLLP